MGVDSPEPDFSGPAVGVEGVGREGEENPLALPPGFSHEYDFLAPNILRPPPDKAMRAVSTDCACCWASVALESCIFFASFLLTDFLSRLGALSPRGVEGADPVGSTDSARPASSRIALLLRLARFAARLSSCELSRWMNARYLAALDFVLEESEVP